VLKIVEFFAGPLGRWAIIGLLMLGAAAFGAAKMHEHDAVAYDELDREHAQYVAQTEAAGAQYEKERLEREAREKREKEKADAERTRSRTALDLALAELRRHADYGGGSAGANPPASKCPDGLTCFDRAEYQRALREFDSAARRLVDEGSKVVVDLNNAKNWAQGK